MKRVFITAALLTLLSTALLTAAGNREAPSPETRNTLEGLAGRPLRAAATTTIVGDVVRSIAGDSVELTVLLKPGQNPHSYEPSPKDIAALENADIVFLNGAGLEEGLQPVLEGLKNPVLVSVSEGLEDEGKAQNGAHHHEHHGAPSKNHKNHEEGRHEEGSHESGSHHTEHHGHHEKGSHESGGHHTEHHGHHGDPHFWFSPLNVIHWSRSIAHALETADPDNAGKYRAAAEDYIRQLENLDREIRQMVSAVPQENRKLVTGHAALGYFARDYGFELYGSILAGFSDQSEASARETAALVEQLKKENIKALFVGKTAGNSVARLAQTIAGETAADGSRAELLIVPLLTGSLAPEGKRGSNYIDFMLYNTEQITGALQ